LADPSRRRDGPSSALTPSSSASPTAGPPRSLSCPRSNDSCSVLERVVLGWRIGFVGDPFPRASQGRRDSAVGTVAPPRFDEWARTRRGDRIASRVCPDAAAGDDGVLGARRTQCDRSTMSVW